MCQGAATIADGKDGRNEFESVCLACVGNFLQTTEVIGALFAESIEAEGGHGAVEPAFARSLDELFEIGDISIVVQAPAE